MMTDGTVLVIDNLEPEISEWLTLEYRHASKLWNGNVVFTSIPDEKSASALRPLGKVENGNPGELFGQKKCIILDPLAEQPLEPKDFQGLDVLIVGGILGYEKPQGRTKKLLSDRYGFPTRNLGSAQLSIDGAVFVAKAVSLGMKLAELEIACEVEIAHDEIHSTILPFGYPVVDNNVIITPGLVEYLTRDDR